MLDAAYDEVDREAVAGLLEAIAVRLQQLADERADALLGDSEVEGRGDPEAADEYQDLLARQAVLEQRLAERSLGQ